MVRGDRVSELRSTLVIMEPGRHSRRRVISDSSSVEEVECKDGIDAIDEISG